MKYLACSIALLVSFSAFAQKKRRHHVAHVHGEAQFSIAAEGKSLEVLFKTPADGLFGFEHEPRDDKEKKLVADQTQKLKDSILKMVALPDGWKCQSQVKKMDIQLAQLRRSSREERLGLPATPKGHGDVTAIFMITCPKEVKGIDLTFSVHAFFPRIIKTRIVFLSETQQLSLKLGLKPKSLKI